MCGQHGIFSDPDISDIDGHLQAGRDNALTAWTPYSFTLPIIHFDSCNQFHVHTYISCWGPGEQSPSLEIIFDSCHGTTSFLPFPIFVCPPPHLCHLLTPSALVHLPSATSAPTPRCTHATMLCPHSD